MTDDETAALAELERRLERDVRLSHRQIAKLLGLSRMTVFNIETRALRKMRIRLGEDER